MAPAADMPAIAPTSRREWESSAINASASSAEWGSSRKRSKAASAFACASPDSRRAASAACGVALTEASRNAPTLRNSPAICAGSLSRSRCGHSAIEPNKAKIPPSKVAATRTPVRCQSPEVDSAMSTKSGVMSAM